MHQHSLKFLAALFVISFFSDSKLALSASEVLADRVLMEVNHTSYTQRQIELYAITVDTLKAEKSVRIASAQNWNAILDFARVDMILDQEALRIGSFDATRKMIDKALEIIDARISSDTAVSTQFKRLQADRSSLSRTVAQALRVENFRRSKQKQASIVNDKEDTNAVNITTRMNVWQKSLEAAAIVRLFANAETYQPLKGS